MTGCAAPARPAGIPGPGPFLPDQPDLSQFYLSGYDEWDLKVTCKLCPPRGGLVFGGRGTIAMFTRWAVEHWEFLHAGQAAPR